MNRRPEIGQVINWLERPSHRQVEELCGDVVDYLTAGNRTLRDAAILADQAYTLASRNADLELIGFARMHLWAVRYVEEHFDKAAHECELAVEAFWGINHSINQLVAHYALGHTREAEAGYQEQRRAFAEAQEAYSASIQAYELGLELRRNIERELFYSPNTWPNRLQVCWELAEACRQRLEQVKDALARCPNDPGSEVVFMRNSDSIPPIPIVDMKAITAGTPVPTIDAIEGYAQVAGNTATIWGEEYRPRSLRGTVTGPRLDWSTHCYFIARVQGHSMNRAGIQDGDYVLLQRPQLVELKPDDGDIVVATMCDRTDERSTIKRFKKQGGKISLEPDSDKIQYKSTSWDGSSWHKNCRICAIVVAVFDKI
jgi:hypothetical protein